MPTDVHSVILRECLRLAMRLGGSRRALFLNGVAILVVSIGLPWMMGQAFVRSVIVIPLACLSVFLVADLVADSFAASAEVSGATDLVGRAVACVLVGWAGGMTMLLGGLLAMNAMNWEGEWLFPPVTILLDAALLSLAASVFVAGLAVCAGRKARLTLKMVMLCSTILLMYGCSRSLISGRIYLTNQRITRLTAMASIFLLANGAALVAYGASQQRD